MLSLIPKPDVTAAGIKVLRSYTALGISDIRRCAADGESIREIEIFGSDWQDECLLIGQIADLLAAGQPVPFDVVEHDEFGSHELLTSEHLDTRIEHWHEIEQETDMHTELELGEISSPDDFHPEDSEWASRALERIRLRRASQL